MSITQTFVGNLTQAPELKTINNDTAVCRVRIAVDDRYRDSNNVWQSRPTQYWDVNGWRELAIAMNEQLSKGDQIVVVGEIRREEWTQDGEKRGRNFIHAQHVAKTLRRPKRQQTPDQAPGGAGDPDWDSE